MSSGHPVHGMLDLFWREAADGTEMVGVVGDLLERAPIARLPFGCEITVDAETADLDALDRTEGAIEAITEQLGGRKVASIRTPARLRTLVYLPTDEHAERFVQIPLPKGASVDVAPAHDPQWTLFDRLRPVGMEQQSMLDHRVFAALFAADDRGGVRQIDHQVVGLAPDRLASFSNAVGSLGMSVRPVGPDAVEVNHDADPAQITPDSWTVRQIAERHGAEYDGWGCAVVGESTRGRRRWWNRR